MLKQRKTNVCLGNEMKILFFVILVMITKCQTQMEKNMFVIDNQDVENSAHNLQANIESMKQISNPHDGRQKSEPNMKQVMILNDYHKIDSIVGKKLQLKLTNNIQDIIQLNEANFKQFIGGNVHVLINFYTKDCVYCTQFNRSLSVIKHRLNSQNHHIAYGSLQLTDSTEKIFKEYNIQAVPEIRYFYYGIKSRYVYSFVEYSGQQIIKLSEWIQRLTRVSEFQYQLEKSHKMNVFKNMQGLNSQLYIKEVNSFQDVIKQLADNSNSNKKVIMMNCSYQWKQGQNKELSQFLKHSYLTHLDHEFYCTQNHSIFTTQSQVISSVFATLPTTDIFLYVYEMMKAAAQNQQQKVIPTLLSRIRLNNNIAYKQKSLSQPQSTKKNHQQQQYTNLSFVYHENMNRYINQKVQYWTNQSVLNVFTHNQPCFVMIINNETLSKKLFLKYEEIKQKLNKNPKFPPIKFYYTDLSLTAQSTTRIKKYISGLETSISQQYPYPLLAYLKPSSNRVKKFLYKGRVTMQGMEKWIVDNINGLEIQIEKGQHLQAFPIESDETKKQTKQFFRTTPESLFPAHYTQKFRQIYHNLEYSLQQKVQKLKIPQEFIAHRNQLKLINFYDMEILLSDLHQKDFFVYINWKNQIKAYELLSEITDFWYSLDEKNEKSKEKQKQSKKSQQKPMIENKKTQDVKDEIIKDQIDNQQRVNSQLPNTDNVEPTKNTQITEQMNQQRKLIEMGTKNQKSPENMVESKAQFPLHHKTDEQRLSHYSSKTNIYILNYNNNDYPPVYYDSQGKQHKLEINHVPSIVYFSADRKKVDKIEGIFNVQQVKMFILHQAKLQENLQNISDQDAIIQQKQEEKAQKKSNTGSGERQLSGIEQHQVQFKKQ